MFTVPTRGIRPLRCYCLKREGGDERCQCPLADWWSSSLNNRKRETGRGRKTNNKAIFCCGFTKIRIALGMQIKLNVVFEYHSKCGNHICHSVD